MVLLDFKGSFVINLVILYQSWIAETRSLPTIDSPSGLHSYMKSYGFVDDGTTVNAESNRDALVKYQRFFGLPETGKLDEQTRKLMEQPRCGEQDINAVSYAIAPKKYVSKHIRWRLNKTDEINFLVARKIISESVQEWLSWMDVLSITESTDPNSEIIVNFVRPDIYGEHGDGRPFTYNDIAHAFYPDNYALSSDIHVSMANYFALQEPPLEYEHSLKWVIMHELGHALGLKHSIHKTSIMYPIVPEGVPYPSLDQDDIYGIKELYGACHTLQCKNGGTCLSVARTPGSVCKCPPTHHGLLCEKACINGFPSDILCDLWAGKGECLVNEEWMQIHCYKSCNRCHLPKCVNLHPDDKECKKWAKKWRMCKCQQVDESLLLQGMQQVPFFGLPIAISNSLIINND